MSASRRTTELRLAFLLLTRLPVGRLGDEAPAIGSAQWAFPVVGLATGLVGWAVHIAVLELGLGPSLAALLSVGALVLATGALHLDGLADFADGIGGGTDRERRLDIMRDSRIGSYGVIALVFAIALQVAAIAGIGGEMPLFAFFLASTASRLAMVFCLAMLPPARSDGLGHSATSHASGSWIAGTVIVLALALATGVPAAGALVLSAAAGGAVCVLAWRSLGGQTGDVLGAVQVSAETACWIGFAAFLSA